MTRIRFVVVLAGALLAVSSCDLPFGLGTPSTRALENGVAASLDAGSLEIAGAYTQVQVSPPAPVVSGARVTPPQPGARWSIDLQLSNQTSARHALLSTNGVKLEAIVVSTVAYFRGQDFLAEFLGGDPQTSQLVKAAGNAWWKGPSGLLPSLPDLTTSALFRTAFLGSAVSSRTDHVSVAGVDAVELSGARADVYVASAAPYRLLRVVLQPRVNVDGVTGADLRYSNYDKDFGIAAPKDVIDFSNLSTLPPIYSVVSVDTSRCGSPCVVSALLKNLGGPTGAIAPSTVVFTLTDPASGAMAGTCTATVTPDVGFNATTTVSCTISLNGPAPNAAIVTATPVNPGRSG